MVGRAKPDWPTVKSQAYLNESHGHTGPNLFNCYIDDLVLATRRLDANISLYADDVDFDCAHIKLRLESLLSIILDWIQCNHINLNVQITKFCIYGYRPRVVKFQERVLCVGVDVHNIDTLKLVINTRKKVLVLLGILTALFSRLIYSS